MRRAQAKLPGRLQLLRVPFAGAMACQVRVPACLSGRRLSRRLACGPSSVDVKMLVDGFVPASTGGRVSASRANTAAVGAACCEVGEAAADRSTMYDLQLGFTA